MPRLTGWQFVVLCAIGALVVITLVVGGHLPSPCVN